MLSGRASGRARRSIAGARRALAGGTTGSESMLSIGVASTVLLP